MEILWCCIPYHCTCWHQNIKWFHPLCTDIPWSRSISHYGDRADLLLMNHGATDQWPPMTPDLTSLDFFGDITKPRCMQQYLETSLQHRRSQTMSRSVLHAHCEFISWSGHRGVFPFVRPGRVQGRGSLNVFTKNGSDLMNSLYYWP